MCLPHDLRREGSRNGFMNNNRMMSEESEMVKVKLCIAPNEPEWQTEPFETNPFRLHYAANCVQEKGSCGLNDLELQIMPELPSLQGLIYQ